LLGQPLELEARADHPNLALDRRGVRAQALDHRLHVHDVALAGVDHHQRGRGVPRRDLQAGQGRDRGQQQDGRQDHPAAAAQDGQQVLDVEAGFLRQVVPRCRLVGLGGRR
jgi:hypothetical protein